MKRTCDICGKECEERDMETISPSPGHPQYICWDCYKISQYEVNKSVECVRERKRIYGIKKKNEGVYKARKREYMRRTRSPEEHKPKPDTIVADGYAERQMAETLKMAGRVKTEL